MSSINEIAEFWKSESSNKNSLTQLQRYEKKNAPEEIKKFISIGGGAKMGTTLERYARFRFKNLKKREKGEGNTGHDQILKLDTKNILVEQKSSGHWKAKADEYKWQHIADKHHWNMLLLCGIDYTEVKFWGMDRKTFDRLVLEGKIISQGDKGGNSSQGMWTSYSKIKDSLIEIKSNEQLIQFASSLQTSE
jgi:hypothetical protein